jgi:hypothetical protein
MDLNAFIEHWNVSADMALGGIMEALLKAGYSAHGPQGQRIRDDAVWAFQVRRTPHSQTEGDLIIQLRFDAVPDESGLYFPNIAVVSRDGQVAMHLPLADPIRLEDEEAVQKVFDNLPEDEVVASIIERLGAPGKTYWKIEFSDAEGRKHPSVHSDEARAQTEVGQRLKAIVRDIWDRFTGPQGAAFSEGDRDHALQTAKTIRNLVHLGLEDIWLAYASFKAYERLWKQTVQWGPFGADVSRGLTSMTLTVTPDPGKAGRM